MKAPLPPNTVQISTHKPFEFGAPTTTMTAWFTWTTTVKTTTSLGFGQTTQMTPVPIATTPMLGAAYCAQPTWEERMNAPYTDWELNFELNQVIIERIYAQLYPFFHRGPEIHVHPAAPAARTRALGLGGLPATISSNQVVRTLALPVSTCTSAASVDLQPHHGSIFSFAGRTGPDASQYKAGRVE